MVCSNIHLWIFRTGAVSGGSRTHIATTFMWMCEHNFYSDSQALNVVFEWCDSCVLVIFKYVRLFCKVTAPLNSHYFSLRVGVFPVSYQPLILSWIFWCFSRRKLLLDIYLGTIFYLYIFVNMCAHVFFPFLLWRFSATEFWEFFV